MDRRFRARLVAAALAAATVIASAQAQEAMPPGAAPAVEASASTGANRPLTLRETFEASWQRQAEALSQPARREAADAARRAATSWTAEPPSIEALAKTDRLNSNAGEREFEVGVSVPLWLPGERRHAIGLAEAEVAASHVRVLAARLRLAASVRDAWWALQRAQLDLALASERLAGVEQLAADVARRVRAGDLSRADQHQADSAVAEAEADLAEATAAQRLAQLELRSLSGSAIGLRAGAARVEPEPVPASPVDLADLNARHATVVDLRARAEVSRRAADLAATRTRSNPELTLATTRERARFGETYDQSLTVGIRVPFGGGSRADAAVAAARADAIEAESQAALERARLVDAIEAARARGDASRAQLDAAQKRARLAREVRGFFEKSFRLGESDLPTRLRVEREADEAERRAARARIDAAAAISALRQALGLLPE